MGVYHAISTGPVVRGYPQEPTYSGAGIIAHHTVYSSRGCKYLRVCIFGDHRHFFGALRFQVPGERDEEDAVAEGAKAYN
jgi:hypothetical protein